MDVAVLSDIHGNYIALERCVEYALEKEIKHFIFLGDYVGELAYPEKTMKLVNEMARNYDCYFVRGNKEDYWIDHRKNGEQGWKDENSTTGSLFYTYQHLSKQDIDFFEGLPISQKISFENAPAIIVCHGSPYKVNEKLLADNARTFEIMESMDTSLILCGHTHIQTKIEKDGKCVLNGGAVGVPLYSEGKAQFLILHEKNQQWEEEFVSLAYDVEKVIEELHTAGLDRHAPYWCQVSENLLRKGNISHGTVLARAMKLCSAENGTCKWPDVPEKYWKQAVQEMLVI